eukprot:scaffold834_cov123-Cylindrotheca_fusiformis.AAC.12
MARSCVSIMVQIFGPVVKRLEYRTHGVSDMMAMCTLLRILLGVSIYRLAFFGFKYGKLDGRVVASPHTTKGPGIETRENHPLRSPTPYSPVCPIMHNIAGRWWGRRSMIITGIDYPFTR